MECRAFLQAHTSLDKTLARALVNEPRLLLLDEPLSNLDAKLRERMRFELKRLQQELGITAIYVTHDQNEALALSHQIAVMNQGRIIQIGSPREIYRSPGNRFVADFVGTTNFLTGRVIVRDGAAGCRLQTPCGELLLPGDVTTAGSGSVTISIRPENILVSDAPRHALNEWAGIIESHMFLGDYQELKVRVGNELLQSRVHPEFAAQSGGKVFVHIEPERCVVVLGDASG